MTRFQKTRDDDDNDDEKDELALDAEGGTVVSIILLLCLTGTRMEQADMRRLLTGWPPDSQDGKNLAPWQRKRAETKAKNTARKQRKTKQHTGLNAKRKEMEKQKVHPNVYVHQKVGC